jgi:hypothetical protein
MLKEDLKGPSMFPTGSHMCREAFQPNDREFFFSAAMRRTKNMGCVLDLTVRIILRNDYIAPSCLGSAASVPIYESAK